MKKTVKKVSKTVKPDFVMNLIDNTSVDSLYIEFIEAKVRAGKPITIDELYYIEDKVIDMAINEIMANIGAIMRSIPCKEYRVENGAKLVFDESGNAKVVKPNIFRRFWNWVTGK